MCQVLQSVREVYYKVRQVLQSVTVITNWNVTYGKINNFFFQTIYLCKNKNYNLENMEQCPTKYILDLSRGNVKSKTTIKEKILKQNDV